MTFEPNFMTTLVGSFPHQNSADILPEIISNVDVPVWPQLPRRDFRESMYVQYSASLPRVILKEEEEKIQLDTQGDLTPDLETFYEKYLADDLEAFRLPRQYALGFYNLLDTLQQVPGDWVKGHVTGPVSFGLTVVDQDLRSVLYNEFLADVIVKNMAMNARWQIRTLKSVKPNVIIFVDEPYMASFGSAFISLSREQVMEMLNEIFNAIHSEGGLAGVHCCANTDWSVLLKTEVDILNLDAYGYLETLSLYPAELRDFLNRGGIIAWGIIPNDEEIYKVTPQSLAEQLSQGMTTVCEKANSRGITITLDELARQSMLTPTCGMGSTTEEVAKQVLTTIPETAKRLRQALLD